MVVCALKNKIYVPQKARYLARIMLRNMPCVNAALVMLPVAAKRQAIMAKNCLCMHGNMSSLLLS